MSLTLEEKYQILTAYMQGGGVQGLLEPEINEDDERQIEEEFKMAFDSDPKLREALGGMSAFTALSLKEKYQILETYKRGGIEGLLEEGGTEEGEEEDESSVIMHEGKKFRRVQIEGENQEYLMDEAGNIYDTEFNYVGQANGSDEEDGGNAGQ